MPVSDSNATVSLDLVDPAVYAPKLRRVAVIAVIVGVLVAAGSALVVPWPVAIAIGLVVGGPTAGYMTMMLHRRMWMSGTVVNARHAVRTKRIDLAAADRAELVVYPGRIARVVLSVSQGETSQNIPLAMYTEQGSGRELNVLALRSLADGLAAGELAAGAALSSALVQQLRAMARDATLGERPLFRAFRKLRDLPSVDHITLTDSEVAQLVV